ncbi:MAG: class I SAM-dependent methyltransferase [Actinobacteria bacterium]|nr:class I SAM-dependent methyltransferase [Actinomycetota bacterium]
MSGGATSATVMAELPEPDWYRPIAAHLRGAYLRYSFTKGTTSEVDFLYEVLEMAPGMRLLDVGMGPGRHSVELAKRGLQVVGVDISSDFVEVARAAAIEEGISASFFPMDARHLPFEEEFDVVMSICEGAFSLGIDDLGILRAMARSAKPGGKLAVASVNVFYVCAHMEAGDFDPATMLYRETTEVIGEDGSKRSFEMWNSCFTPREMEWIANGAGLDPDAVYGIAPGAYAKQAPTRDHPELLLIATKPES